MSPFAPHLLHQAFFGGRRGGWFCRPFNCPPRLLWIAFGAGARLAVRTGGQEIGGLPSGGFIHCGFRSRAVKPDFGTAGFAALSACSCGLHPDDSRQPGGQRLDEPLRAPKGESWRGASAATAAVENLMLVVFTLVGVGTALAIPPLLFPVVPKQNNDEMA